MNIERVLGGRSRIILYSCRSTKLRMDYNIFYEKESVTPEYNGVTGPVCKKH